MNSLDPKRYSVPYQRQRCRGSLESFAGFQALSVSVLSQRLLRWTVTCVAMHTAYSAVRATLRHLAMRNPRRKDATAELGASDGRSRAGEESREPPPKRARKDNDR